MESVHYQQVDIQGQTASWKESLKSMENPPNHPVFFLGLSKAALHISFSRCSDIQIEFVHIK